MPTFSWLAISGQSRTFKKTGQQFRDLVRNGSTGTLQVKLCSFYPFTDVHRSPFSYDYPVTRTSGIHLHMAMLIGQVILITLW